ncbi:MAG: rnz [Thermoleophilia bacterium]|nr:rnz [Thermoleophilia bacterium]
MDLDLVVLGSAASVPSAARGLSSALIRRGGARLLIDCGEGTQRQLMRSTGLGELDAVLLTHLHADHVLGLPGMLKTFGLRDRTEPLLIAGPPGLDRFLRVLQPVIGRLPFRLEVEETDGMDATWSQDGCIVRAIPTDHGVPSVGWVLEEEDRPGRFDVDHARALGVREGADFGVLQRGGDVIAADGTTVTSSQVLGEHRSGRTIVYTGDTAACVAVREAAHEATLLVHEATFLEVDADRARETGHSTAHDAALTAAAANVELLVLTHVSTRYMPREIEREARGVFAASVVARDFDLVELPFPERGAPRHVVRGGRSTGDPVAIQSTHDDGLHSAE